jgi:putative colanic acid biosynthesis acetyltransferase WcaF
MFRISPRPLWGFRCALLRLFGAKIGKYVRLHPTVRISIPWNLVIEDGVGIGDESILYALGSITIGEAATVSQGAHICAGTHDFRDPDMPLMKQPVCVGSGAWICAEAFVGPGVTIGQMAVVGARAVVMRDVPAAAIMVGNPARQTGQRQFIVK